MLWPLAVSTWGEEELAAATDVLKSGQTTMGEKTKEFERQFAAYHGMAHGIMVNSGSSANLVATASLFYKLNRPLKPGDEVIVPAISWATTYYPLHQYGLRLRFVDVELETLNMDVDQLERAITRRTKAIVAVSILGNPANLWRIEEIAKEHDLYLIEDNCESLDAETDGRKTGTFGDLNTFSFFFSHHISTMEGGMILTDNPELAGLCRSIRAHGWDRDAEVQQGPVEEYRFSYPGYNVRPLEISAAIGIEQLKKLPKFTQYRRENWYNFKTEFANHRDWIIQEEEFSRAKSSAFAFTLIPRKTNPFWGRRIELFHMLKEAGIGSRMITGGLILDHLVSKHLDYSSYDNLPNATRVHREGIFVGNHPYDLTKNIQLLKRVLSQ